MISIRVRRFLFPLSLSLIAAAQELTIKSKTELVQVPVVVTKNGEVVKGLTKDDFRLIHDGKPQKIEVFEEVDIPPVSLGLPQRSPHSVQNYVPPQSRQDLIIMVLDLQQGWPSTPNIWTSLRDMCRRFVEARTPVSVLLLTNNGLVQIHSFTAAPEDLTRVIAAITNASQLDQPPAGMPAGPTPSVFSQMSRLGEQNDPAGSVVADINDLRFSPASRLTPIETIAEAYRGIPGRKKLIWVSTNFMGGTQAFTTMPDARRAMQAFHEADAANQAWMSMSDANIAVYPIDSNGQEVPGWADDFDVTRSGERFNSLFPVGTTTHYSDTGSMLKAAQETGGKTCVNLIETCITRVVEDAKHYYLLGFYLGRDVRQGWHNIKVNANGDFTLRNRHGFTVGQVTHADTGASAGQAWLYANNKTPLVAHDQTSPRFRREKDPVLIALASPVDYTSVPLLLQWSAKNNGDTSEIALRLASPPGGVNLDPDTKELKVDILLYWKPSGSSSGDSVPQSIAAHPNAEQRNNLANHGFTYLKKITLAKGRYTLRVLLRDNTTNRIGTVTALIDTTSGSGLKVD